MEPRLIAISGPLKGLTIPLEEAETIIGREPGNAVAISDPLVSRRHCSIRRDDSGKVQVSDLESLNGTFVNGVQAQERALEHGDNIKIGSSEFIFLVEGSETESVLLADPGDEELLTTMSFKVDGDSAIFLQPPRIAERATSSTRYERDLTALLRISSAINAIRQVEDLQARVLEMIFEVIPVERAAILLVNKNVEGFISGTYRARISEGTQPFRISRTIGQQVLHDGVAVIASDQQIQGTESLIASHIRSLLCVPMMVFGSTLGIIYADTTETVIQLDEHHLQLLTAIASIAAVALEHARYVEWLEGENQRLQAEISIEHDMIGQSARMREVYQFISKVANTDSTVLICGESGTGKELVARAIHHNSKRHARPFVAINCAAIPEQLLESELFGHERGAFSGAVMQKKGKIEVADGGTLFLDEVAELAPQLQAKLLRVLQEREFERLGSTRPIKIDMRLITATNRDLGEAIKAGQFRQDLFFRLNVLSITLPPLRDRREDIPTLVNHFVRKYSAQANRKVIGIMPQVHALLKSYDWPGNVRELENAIERAVVLGSSETIRPEDLPEALLETKQGVETGSVRYHEAVNNVKRDLILRALEEAGGSFTEAAKLLDLHPNYLHRLVRNMDLRKHIK
jgi:transcriptional regulator with GAF, ATPase, and Fis domain